VVLKKSADRNVRNARRDQLTEKQPAQLKNGAKL
jgi:hypothetical protein